MRGDYPAMARDNTAIVRRLREALKEAHKTPRAASIEADLGPDAIRDLFRKRKTIPTIDTLEALAPVVNRTPQYLAWGIGGYALTALTMRIKGEVAAGLWLDIDGTDDREFEQYPVPFHPRYPEEGQYGLIVVGTSINKRAGPGAILQCLDCGISGVEPRENDLVIVERRRAQAGQKEVTAKVFRRKGRIIELAPDSTDKRWSEPLTLDPHKAPADEEIAIIAVVIGVYTPLHRT